MKTIVELIISAFSYATADGTKISWSKVVLWAVTVAAIVILAFGATSCKIDQGYVKYAGKIVRKDSVEYSLEKVENNRQIIKMESK